MATMISVAALVAREGGESARVYMPTRKGTSGLANGISINFPLATNVRSNCGGKVITISVAAMTSTAPLKNERDSNTKTHLAGNDIQRISA